MSENPQLPKFRDLLVVAACPEELLVPLGAMVSAFAGNGTRVRAVLLSDGLSATTSPEDRHERNRRLVRAAECLGVAEVILLKHSVTDVPRTGVRTMAQEVLDAMERADAILVADPHDRRDRSARGRLATFRAALRVASVIGAPIYVCTSVAPGSRGRSATAEITLSRASQRSAIAWYNGVPEVRRREAPDPLDVEYLLSPQRRETPVDATSQSMLG